MWHDVTGKHPHAGDAGGARCKQIIARELRLDFTADAAGNVIPARQAKQDHEVCKRDLVPKRTQREQQQQSRQRQQHVEYAHEPTLDCAARKRSNGSVAGAEHQRDRNGK